LIFFIKTTDRLFLHLCQLQTQFLNMIFPINRMNNQNKNN
jgi:hypothetical protein